jgi:predicted kinase
MMFHGVRYTGVREYEDLVTETQHAAIRAALVRGFDGIVDDTWLNDRRVSEIRALADEVGAGFEVWDMRDVPPEPSTGRQACRDRSGSLLPDSLPRCEGHGHAGRREERGMSRLIITRGLAGCGKTTRALRWAAGDPSRVRVNRDDLRMMFHGVRYTGVRECEDLVTDTQHAAIRAALVRGFDGIADDTWLNDRRVSEIRALAGDVGADFEVWDMRDVPPKVCIERDKGRGSLVGAKAINEMYERYLKSRPA